MLILSILIFIFSIIVITLIFNQAERLDNQNWLGYDSYSYLKDNDGLIKLMIFLMTASGGYIVYHFIV